MATNLYPQDNYPHDVGFKNNNMLQNVAYAPLQIGASTPDELKVEKLLLVITWVSLFNCVMKMDYNVALYLFLYYIWITRPNNQHYKAYLVANAVFIGLDTLWFLINMNSWGSGFEDESQKYQIWLSFRVYRIFTLTICVIIIILKIVLAYFQFKAYQATQPKALVVTIPPVGVAGAQLQYNPANPAGAYPPMQQQYNY